MKFFVTLLLSTVVLLANQAFITPNQLSNKLNDKNLVILDTTDKENYSKGHIPNARQVEISSFRHWVNNEYMLMNSPKEIEKVAQELGINNDSYVVLYGHNKPKELLKASYIALALIVNSFENISILDGGYNEWKNSFKDNPKMFSTKFSTYKQGNFKAQYNPDILVNMEYVQNKIGSVPMIEARPKEYFDGTTQSKGVKRLGHIKNAQSSNWQNKFAQDEKLIDDTKLKNIFYKDHNLTQNNEVITYCTGGLEASMNWYLLSQYLEFKDVKLYDASMKEWGNRESTPMEK
ncbi:MAG: sulfurtransferase [Campylobacterales bacterium]|nr:sulfurtransferase [Campylobacterales bacterium]